MPDIFISYSRKDAPQAEQLAELLASAGLSCWIDRQGIDLATSWSREIVQAIDGCKAFVVLLSLSSIESLNVAREVSLASEKRKKILPLDLEPVALSEELQYHLAGIQRAPMTNIDAIIRALGKLGLEATAAPQAPKIVKESDGRKSLMILPFDDLSPTGDNGWFADGIASELITALTNVNALRVADPQATKDFKRYQGTLPKYANEMNIRYFVQGDVRKFGDSIKITTRLLDVETGDFLWQDSMKGVMNDIFEIQEAVALNVVEGLKVHLASDEKKKLAERGTENSEAYELFLKANEYFARQAREGIQFAIELLSEAIKVDPGYANAYQLKAHALAVLYRGYRRDPALLEEGIHLVEMALRLNPELWRAYYPRSVILQLQGKLDEAERSAKEFIVKAPEDFTSHFALGFFYMETRQFAEAIAPYERSLSLKPDYMAALINIVACCNNSKEEQKQRYWAELAIPICERHLKLFPEAESDRVTHALLLHFAGKDDDAREAAARLGNLRDGFSLFNTACLLCWLDDYEGAFKTFRRAIEAGYRNMPDIKALLDAENEGIGKLKGTPEYEAVKQMVEKLEAEAASAQVEKVNG